MRATFVPKYLSGFLVLLLCSCSTLERRSSSLSLATAAKLQAGVSTKTDIEKLLGAPHKILRLEDFPEQKDDGEIWMYVQEPFANSSRLSCYFKKGSSVVASVGWDVREGEPEQNLDMAKDHLKGRFPSVNFQEREEGAVLSHFYSDNKYFEDPKLGLAIFYRMGRKEVSGITWSDPKIYAEMTQKLRRKLSCMNSDCPPNR